MDLSLIIIIVILIFPALLYWIFKDAGVKPWKALIPIYNYWQWIKVIDKKWWWFALMFIPYLNVFMIMLMVVETVKCYGKFKLSEQAIGVIVPFAYLPYLGISPKEKYILPENRVRVKKTITREWVDAIIFAVVAATIIRTFMFEAYVIPTPSMERSLMVGDYLFVSKMSYGPKLPNTPLSFPFVHNTMPLSQTAKSYLEWIKWPYYRFPGITEVKRHDAVVFNYPDGDTVALLKQDQSFYQLIYHYGRDVVFTNPDQFGNITSRPVDKRMNYIKRCIGLPGDTLEIKNQEVYINGKLDPLPVNSQFIYNVKTDGSPINPKVLRKLNIDEQIGYGQDGIAYFLTAEAASKLREYSNIISVEKMSMPEEFNQDIFPHSNLYPWTIDNYGPIWIPKAGTTVNLTLQNLPFYQRIISAYEGNSLVINGNQIIINGKPATTYTFKQDYYWMMGDNRQNSADSRYWGFVPYDHIVGKAVFVWLSLDKNRGWFDGKIRWNKLFRVVK